MAKRTRQNVDLEPIFWSALALMVGALIAVFGASLRSSYSSGSSYTDAVHIRIAPGLIMTIGTVVAALGVAGIVRVLIQRDR